MVDLISLLIVSYLEALETTGRYEGGKYLNILRCAGEAATDDCADATLEEVESGNTGNTSLKFNFPFLL